ncbi:MAG: hypothetical protein E1N59_498 [Puniceicoccaceae bacterium 5H]|nr:MAG: hypothetical protein E1N59_498 [Puniceicoccaceae bacterium 5H]
MPFELTKQEKYALVVLLILSTLALIGLLAL